MHFLARKLSRPCLHNVWVAGLLASCSVSPAFAQQITTASMAGVTDAQLTTWHDNLRNYTPTESGCFHTRYPQVQWEKIPCEPKPKIGPLRNLASSRNGAMKDSQTLPASLMAQNAGGGNDYIAQTAGITQAALGTFPVVKGVTSESSVGGAFDGPNEFSLQLNSNFGTSSALCNKYGYTSCSAWEQFAFFTGRQGSPEPSMFIQNWIFPSPADYANRGCPTGWNDASTPTWKLCYINSQATNAANIDTGKLDQLELSGVVANGIDTAIVSQGLDTYSIAELDDTVYLSSWWKQSEFNLFGFAGGAKAVFSPGTSLKVRLVVRDGSTNAPTCLNGGTTAEENNLNLGKCDAEGGASPRIHFTESN